MTRLLSAGALALVFAVASLTDADPDLWGHVRFGLDMARTHRLPAVDPYSFTQDRPWINHEWLSELQMALAWAAGGTAGLVALKGALVVAAVIVVWLALRGVSFGTRLMVMAVFVIGAGRALKTLRPQLWSILCFAVLCRVLAERSPRGRRWLPLLFVVWANVHGGWLVGLGVLAVWTIVTIAREPREARRLLTTAVLCALATLCTPYGWTLWGFLWQTVGVTRDISEWQPLWTVPVIAWLPWLAAIAMTAWAFRQNDLERWARTAVVLMLAYFSLRVERVLPFFVGAAVLFVAPLLRRAPVHRNGAARQPAVAAVLGLAMAGAALWIAYPSHRCIPVRGGWTADPEAAQVLRAAGQGRVVVPFDWGEYAIWHMGPRLRVSMDGRRETVYSDQRLAEHDAVVAGTASGVSTLEAWRPEYVWLPVENSRTRDWLALHDYRIEVNTARSFIGVRRDVPNLSAFAAISDATARCFPD